MARETALVAGAVVGLLIAGCSSGAFPRVGGSLPGADSVQTVSDAADALDLHRGLASESAKEAIGTVDALGSYVRDLSGRERYLELPAGRSRSDGTCGVASTSLEGSLTAQRVAYYYDARCRSLAVQIVRTTSQTSPGSATMLESASFFGRGHTTPLAVRSDASEVSRTRANHALTVRTSGQLSTTGGARFLSGSEVTMLPSLGNVAEFCLSSAGYAMSGIPSLDETFGWDESTLADGARTTGWQGLARWFATVNGDVVRAPIGTLTLSGGAGHQSCPMDSPAFALAGAVAHDAFSMPISVTFARGALQSVSVYDAKFSQGESLNVETLSVHGAPYVDGAIERANSQIGSFRVDAFGNGTLTITSTGAQYVVTDWLVSGT